MAMNNTSKTDDEIVNATSEEEENEVQGKDKFVLVHGDYSEVDDIEDSKDDSEDE